MKILKRIIIFFVFILLIVGAFYLSRLMHKEPVATCFDGIRNQNEEEADCGGICEQKCIHVADKSLQVKKTGFTPSGLAGKVDLYAFIENPNQLFGSSSFAYQFIAKKSDGTALATLDGSSFVLPGDKKYLVATNVEVSENPASVELVFKDVAWSEANDYYETPQVDVVSKNYTELSDGTGFSQLTGLLKNESPLDFSQINIKAILADDAGNILALNSTQMGTVRTGDNRGFKMMWPSRFAGKVAEITVQVEVNVFDSEAFMTRYFKPQGKQKYR